MATRAPRSYHHGNLRAALLERAEETLRTGGAGRLSLRELARDIGVSHAAPRRHFPDKQALLDALAEDGFERLGRELREAMDAAGEQCEPRLLAFGRAYVTFATRHSALLELMFAGKHREGAAPGLRDAADRAFEAPRVLLAEGQAAGDVVAGDPDELTVATWATVQGLATLFAGGMLPEEELDATVAAAVERLVLGLRPRAEES
jgi:AcrR family transcriptional regulator